MKKAAFFVLPSIVLISQVSLHAQVYTQNLVGYVNFDFYAGVNLFANPLDDSVDFGTPPNAINKLSSIFPDSGQGAPPNGTELLCGMLLRIVTAPVQSSMLVPGPPTLFCCLEPGLN